MTEAKTVFTGWQVLLGSVLLIVLFGNLFPMFTGLSEHGFLFADPCLQRISVVAVSLIPTAILCLTYFGPHTFGRTCLLWALGSLHVIVIGLISFACFFTGGNLFQMLDRQWFPERSISGKFAQLGNVTVRLTGDEFFTSLVECRSFKSLHIERYLLGRTFIEYKTLITVAPSVGHFEVLDSGRKFKYCDSTSNREIIRVYDADWDVNVARRCERIRDD